MKVCSGCKIEKVSSEFHKDQRRKDGIQTRCKQCQQETSREFRNSNPDYYTERWETNHNSIKWIFWIHQGGRCAICFDVISMVDVKTRRSHLDHDASCCFKGCNSCRRGLLCPRCNQGIGMLKEDHNILLNAISYLSVC